MPCFSQSFSRQSMYLQCAVLMPVRFMLSSMLSNAAGSFGMKSFT